MFEDLGEGWCGQEVWQGMKVDSHVGTKLCRDFETRLRNLDFFPKYNRKPLKSPEQKNNKI